MRTLRDVPVGEMVRVQLKEESWTWALQRE